MREFRLEKEIRLPCPPQEVFPFFADAANLEQITPDCLNFEILTPRPIDMQVGTLIDYKLRVRGIPIRWRTKITVWEPPFRFQDEQLKGPYRQWIHEHTFEEKEGGTLCRDVVRYAVWGGWIIDKLFVRRDVEGIFEFRQRRLNEIFEPRDGQRPGPEAKAS
ncbi:MAG TPA: SRPBCC family protein [Acidobacteriota bacterium]|nr:SRPBCC family protein [Acidobacteriota bacterium]